MRTPSNLVIPITPSIGARPSVIPTSGDRRIVKLIETPLGWGHAIWTSPYTVEDTEVHATCHVCVVLVGKGPPKPEPIIMTIPVEYLKNCPEDAIEW